MPTWCSAMSPACCRTALRATSKLSTTSAAGAPSARGKCCEYGDTKGLGGLPFPEGRGKQGRLRAAAVGKHLQNSLLPPKCCAGAGWAVGLCAHPWAGMLCCGSAMLPCPPPPAPAGSRSTRKTGLEGAARGARRGEVACLLVALLQATGGGCHSSILLCCWAWNLWAEGRKDHNLAAYRKRNGVKKSLFSKDV